MSEDKLQADDRATRPIESKKEKRGQKLAAAQGMTEQETLQVRPPRKKQRKGQDTDHEHEAISSIRGAAASVDTMGLERNALEGEQLPAQPTTAGANEVFATKPSQVRLLQDFSLER